MCGRQGGKAEEEKRPLESAFVKRTQCPVSPQNRGGLVYWKGSTKGGDVAVTGAFHSIVQGVDLDRR